MTEDQRIEKYIDLVTKTLSSINGLVDGFKPENPGASSFRFEIKKLLDSFNTEVGRLNAVNEQENDPSNHILH